MPYLLSDAREDGVDKKLPTWLTAVSKEAEKPRGLGEFNTENYLFF